MPLDQLLLLALIQGLTEFLPISSSAHLILLPELTGYSDQGVVIDVAVHVGSLGAVITWYRKDIAQLLAALPDFFARKNTPETRLILWLILGTIPAVLFGAALGLSGLTDLLRSKEVIATTSIVFGIVLYLADRITPRTRPMEGLTLRDVILIGFAQALALIPGTSRSGITMTAARALQFTRTDAARFSMLLSIPVIIASGSFAALELGETAGGPALVDAAMAAAFAFVSAFVSIEIFMRLVERIGFTPFVLYRIALGLALFFVF